MIRGIYHSIGTTLLLAFLSVEFGGCVSQVGGRLYESSQLPQWRNQGGSLGKVTLIISGNTTAASGLKPGEAPSAEKFASIARTALEKLPDTILLDDPTSAKMVADLGDREAIALAKSRGAQSVCVLTVGQYGSRFTIGLVPGWSVESFFLYSLRVLDVQTGNLLMHAVTYRQNGGAYQVYASDSAEALAHDLKPPTPTTQP